MKKMLLGFLFITTMSQAQGFLKYDKLFLETGIGLGIPLSSYSPSGERNGELSLIHFQGSLRYMFNQDIGLLGSLNFDQYNNSKHEKSEQKMMGLELVYNLGNALELPRSTRGQFGLLLHGGAAVGAMSSYDRQRDYVGSLMFGVKPLVALNDKVSFFTDVTFKSTLGQDIYYNGIETTFPNPGTMTGNQIAITFGVIMSLGNNKDHADLLY